MGKCTQTSKQQPSTKTGQHKPFPVNDKTFQGQKNFKTNQIPGFFKIKKIINFRYLVMKSGETHCKVWVVINPCCLTQDIFTCVRHGASLIVAPNSTDQPVEDSRAGQASCHFFQCRPLHWKLGVHTSMGKTVTEACNLIGRLSRFIILLVNVCSNVCKKPRVLISNSGKDIASARFHTVLRVLSLVHWERV